VNIMRSACAIRSWRPQIVQANVYPAEVLVALTRAVAIGTDACYVRRLANTEQSEYRSTTVVRSMDRFYHQTIACSPAVAQAYKDFMGMKHRSALVTIPNGGLLRETTVTAKEKRRSRDEMGIPRNAFVVAHIGRMSPGLERLGGRLETGQKAHDVLISAFAKAFAGNPNCLLTLVGDGPLRPDAEALAKGLAVNGQVRFLGQQPEPWTVLTAADVFCLPSRYEGLPNVLPEAASCGLPVVASDIPEISDLSPGKAWQLVPVDDVPRFADALRNVSAEQATYASRGCETAAGLRVRFSMKICAEKYLQAYESALQRSGHASRDRSRRAA
jgi:glycosyltransferase involved in cell wall biosynthesis